MATTNRRSIFAQLKDEHRALKDLLHEAEDAKPSERANFVKKIKNELVPHARGEEKTLYSALMGMDLSKKVEDIVKEAYVEHASADELLNNLADLDSNDEMWKASLEVLKENIEHHIKEEENDFFPAVQNYISAELSQELLAVYLAEKDKFSESLPSQAQIRSQRPASDLGRTLA